MAYPDKAALRTLFNTYWTSQGWRPSKDRKTSQDDFEAAKKAGIMLDPQKASHDSTIAMAIYSAGMVTASQVADAFVASLTSRRLDLRSALGSYAFLRHMPSHSCMESSRASKPGKKQCDICGDYEKEVLEDLNVLNFERFKWGGVRHLEPLYAGLDLSLFHQFGHLHPTTEDKALFKALIEAIEKAPAKTTAPQLEKFFPKELPSNKPERDTLTAILGIAGILGTQDHPGFWQSFVPINDRADNGQHFEDMAYPASLWRRSNGIGHEALHHWFGHLL